MTEYEFKATMNWLSRKYADLQGKDIEDVREELIHMLALVIGIVEDK